MNRNGLGDWGKRGIDRDREERKDNANLESWMGGDWRDAYTIIMESLSFVPKLLIVSYWFPFFDEKSSFGLLSYISITNMYTKITYF